MEVLDWVTRDMVLWRVAETSSTIWLPRAAAWTALSISSLVALAAWSDCPARLRTSLETTAKPFPADPARAASTAAFRARMLVWKAMFSMVAIIRLICWEASVISFMAETIWSICPLLTFTCSPVRRAPSWASAAAFTFRAALLERLSRVA